MRKHVPIVLVGILSLTTGVILGAGRILPPPTVKLMVTEPTAEVSTRSAQGGPDSCETAPIVSWSLDGEPPWIDTTTPRTGRVARIRTAVNGRELRIAAMIPARGE